ncbi:hypothetical protein [Vibrio sp. 03_296]
MTTGQLLESWRGSQNEQLLSRLAGWEIPSTMTMKKTYF